MMLIEGLDQPDGRTGRLAGRLVRIVLACALTGTTAVAATPASPPQAGDRLETLKAIGRAADASDCDTVIRLGTPLLDAPGGTGLSDALEAIAAEIVVRCELRKESKDAAYIHALRGTRLEHGSDLLWRFRLALELDANKDEAALATLEAMTQGRGAALNAIPVSWMWQLSRKFRESGRKEQRTRLLRLLGGDGYAPDDLFGSNSSFRYAYARILAESGDSAGARAMLARVRSPESLAEASVDPLLRPLLADGLDLRAAAEAELARDRDLIARYPVKLDPILWTVGDLRRLGRPQEALDLLIGVQARIADEAAFTDRDDKLNWYWDALGRTYAALGRHSDSVASFRKGAALGEGDNPNVSQVINLAETQNEFGHGDEALRTLAVFDDERKSSPYGEMEMRFARGCAHSVAGRAGGAAADLAFAKAHEMDHPEALADLLLCLGDMDGAAAAFIRRLDDPDRRAGALLQLSDYDDPPVALPPHPVNSRLPALKARPDVKAAIERAGGVRRFRLQRGEL
jgi:tetratricopeptide (TPR) repeat protein